MQVETADYTQRSQTDDACAVATRHSLLYEAVEPATAHLISASFLRNGRSIG